MKGKKNVRTKTKEEHLPFALGYLTEDLQQAAERNLGETEEKMQTALQELRQLIANEPNLYMRTDDIFLLQFLRVRKYEVPKAFKNIQNYYKFRKKYTRIYDNPDNTEVHEALKTNFAGFLPFRTEKSGIIAVIKLGMWDPAEISRDLLIWIASHCVIHALEDPSNQIAGFTIILDLRGVGFRHFQQLTMENIILIHDTMVHCFPGRVANIHVVGMTPIFSTVWKIIYPIILAIKIRKRIHIHGNDMTSLHEHISPAILPLEYGGELGPFDNSWWHALLLEKNEWCLQHRFYGYRN